MEDFKQYLRLLIRNRSNQYAFFSFCDVSVIDGQAGRSAITPREFSICSRTWADFVQKAVWPDLKMRKSLNTHTRTHIAEENLALEKKKPTRLIHNCKCLSLCVETARSTDDKEQEAMGFIVLGGFFPLKARQSSGSVGNWVRGLRDFHCTVSGWAPWKPPLK